MSCMTGDLWYEVNEGGLEIAPHEILNDRGSLQILVLWTKSVLI